MWPKDVVWIGGLDSPPLRNLMHRPDPSWLQQKPSQGHNEGQISFLDLLGRFFLECQEHFLYEIYEAKLPAGRGWVNQSNVNVF